jgi:hypothetical protein
MPTGTALIPKAIPSSPARLNNGRGMKAGRRLKRRMMEVNRADGDKARSGHTPIQSEPRNVQRRLFPDE